MLNEALNNFYIHSQIQYVHVGEVCNMREDEKYIQHFNLNILKEEITQVT